MSTIYRQNCLRNLGGAATITVLLLGDRAVANDFTAEKIIKEMKNDEQVAYFAGVVEGLAVARYHKDGKRKEGMGCIYDWFYKDKQTVRLIVEAFERYPAYPPGSIIDVLAKRKCGE